MMNFIQHLTNESEITIYFLRLFLSILQPIFFYRLSYVILNLNNSKKEKYVFLLTMTIVSCITIFFPNSLIKDLVNIASFLISMILILHQSIKKSFIALVSSYICTIISDYISELILMIILKCTLDDILTIPIYFLLTIILIYMIFALIIILIKTIKTRKFPTMFGKMSLKTSIILNLILGVFTMVLESYLLSIYTDLIPFELSLIIIITLMLYFSISMYSIIRTNTLEKTKADLENEILYNKTLTVLHDNIRGFKHDFNNIVQSIGGYIALKDMSGLEDYYKSLLKDCKLTNNLNILNPETINNPSIYSLLTNKYYIASQKNITMTFSIFTDLSKINFNMYELSRILGILLDNAIEAAEETEQKIIEIEFISDNKKQLFIIRNSCKDSSISTTKIFEKGYSTKNRNSGIGLWKVHKILSKNTNLDLFTTVKDNIFSQQLEVFY